MVKNGNFTLLLTCSGQEWHFCHELDRKTFMFLSKPRHVTPQIDGLRKTSPVVRVSTHIYGVFEEIHGKTFSFRVNLGM